MRNLNVLNLSKSSSDSREGWVCCRGGQRRTDRPSERKLV